jgi:hypothetical protein
MSMTDSKTQLVELVAAEPSLSPVLHSHLDEYDEILRTLLIAEIIDWVVEHRHDRPEVGLRVLAWMNDKYETGSDEVREVIASGGVEAMPNPGQPGSELRAQGPAQPSPQSHRPMALVEGWRRGTERRVVGDQPHPRSIELRRRRTCRTTSTWSSGKREGGVHLSLTKKVDQWRYVPDPQP